MRIIQFERQGREFIQTVIIPNVREMEIRNNPYVEANVKRTEGLVTRSIS